MEENVADGAFLDAEEKDVRLTVLTGLDEFGHEVLELARRQLSVLPEVLQYSTRFLLYSSDDHGDLASQLLEAQKEILAPRNIRNIESTPGWEIPQVTVHHHIVGGLESINSASSVGSTLGKNDSVDSVTGIAFSDDFEEGLANLERDHFQWWSQLFFSSLTSQNGVHFNQAQVQASITGALLTFIIKGVPDPGRDLSALGSAGFYGLTGPALHRLATHLGQDLIAHHRSGEEISSDDELPDRMRKFAEEHHPQELAKRLILDADLQPRKTADETPLAVDSVPATPSWNGDQLSVSLSEGQLGLDLAPRGEEEKWASQIREYSRSFDMTIGYKWRRQLEEAASHLSMEIRESFGTRIRSFLDSEPHSPIRVRRLLQQIEEQIQDARPADKQIPDLDSVIQELEDAVAKRPNRLALSLRLAVWVVPALLAGSIALNGLYGGTRGVVFPGILIVLGGALAIGWALWRIQSARDALQDAREQVLGLVTARQEALLAKNTVDYLNDEVLVTLTDAVEEAQDIVLEEYDQTLEDAEGKLSSKTQDSLDTPLTFEPILSRPTEYDRLLERTVDDLPGWLERAVEDKTLESDQEDLSSQLVSWCENHLKAHLKDHPASKLDFLWQIREDVRENEDDLGDALSSLWDFSAPLLKDGVLRRYGPEDLSKTQEVLIPNNFDKSRIDLESSDIPEKALQELRTAPILICLQTRALSLD